MAYATTISKWGNSEAVRIPRELLRSVGLREGDKVNISVAAQGGIHIAPECRKHRRVKPDPSVTYETLFGGFNPAFVSQGKPWGDEDLVGAEWEAWS